MKKLTLLLCLIVIFISVHAQVPVNDEPCGAIDVPVQLGEPLLAVCVPTTIYTYANATLTAAIPNPTCVGITSGIKDVWYKFTVPASGTCVISTGLASSNNDIVMAAYTTTACNGTFTEIDCNDNNPGIFPTLVTFAAPGEIIYIRIFMLDATANAEFKMCVSDYSINNNPLVDNSSKVGIGTTNPLAKLDVAGSGLFRDKVTFVKDVELRSGIKLTTGAAGGNLLTSDASGNASWLQPALQANYWSFNGGNIYNNTFGNVGINFNSPSERLHVDGNIKLGTTVWSSVASDRTIKFGDGSYVTIGERFGDDQLHLNGDKGIIFRTNGDLERMRIDLNGRVGIGTASPTNKLSIAGNADFTGNVGIGNNNPTTAKLVIGGSNGTEGIDLASSDQYANMRVIRNSLFGPDKDMFIGFGSGANSSLHLYSNNIETITAKNSNVGIGNSDPIYLLDISKRIRLRSESASFGAGIWFNKNDNSSENIFLGNDVSNNLQVFSLIGSRTIASFNPSSGGFRVEGPVAASSGNFIASFGGNGDFMIDKPGQIGGRLAIKENGAIAVGGAANTGAAGQVLTSNGGGSSPSWANNSNTEQYNNHVEKIMSPQQFSTNTSNPIELTPYTHTLVLTKPSLVILTISTYLFTPACALCGTTNGELSVMVGSTNYMSVIHEMENDRGLTFTGSRAVKMSPGTYEFKVLMKKHPTEPELRSSGSALGTGYFDIQVIPQ
jgi:hypothetical protein